MLLQAATMLMRGFCLSVLGGCAVLAYYIAKDVLKGH